MIRRLVILISLPIIILAGWYFILGQKANDRMDITRTRIAEAEKCLFIRKAQLSGLEQLIEKYSRLHEQIALQDIPYSGFEEIVDYYNRIHQTCSEPDYKLEEITPSLDQLITFLRQWENSGGRQEIPFHISINGQYLNLSQLIKTIENDYSFHRLQRIRITAPDHSYPECHMELAFAAYLDQFRSGGSHD